MCTKDLYMYMIILNKWGLKIKVRKQYEEEILGAGYRFIELIILNDNTAKIGMISLLERLNNLSDMIDKEYHNYTQGLKLNPQTVNNDLLIMEVQSYAYAVGRIAFLKTFINYVLDKFADSENNLTDTEQKNIIEKSKQNEDFNYTG